MGPLIQLIGAFGFSSLGLIAPVSYSLSILSYLINCTNVLNTNNCNDFIHFQVVIELVTFYDIGYGRFNWILYKNFICIAFGLFALVFGSIAAILDII